MTTRERGGRYLLEPYGGCDAVKRRALSADPDARFWSAASGNLDLRTGFAGAASARCVPAHCEEAGGPHGRDDKVVFQRFRPDQSRAEQVRRSGNFRAWDAHARGVCGGGEDDATTDPPPGDDRPPGSGACRGRLRFEVRDAFGVEALYAECDECGFLEAVM